jgi:hypothetical protein
MPREAQQACVAETTFEYDGKPYPLALNTAGAVHLSKDAVRALCGPVDKAAHVHIAKRTWWRGKCVAIDGVPTDAMPEGWTLNAMPHFERMAKEARGISAKLHPIDDAAYMLQLARTYDPIRPMTERELADPVACAPKAVAATDQPQAEISPVESIASELAVLPAAAVESCHVPQMAEAAAVIEPGLVGAVPESVVCAMHDHPDVPDCVGAAFDDEPEPADDAPIDRFGALEARIVALEAALAARGEAAAIISAPTIEAANLVARPSRAVRERMVRAYLRMRSQRNGARFQSQLHRDLHALAERSAKYFREMVADKDEQIAAWSKEHDRLMIERDQARAKRGLVTRLALSLRKRLAAALHDQRNVKNYEHEHAVAIARCQHLAADLAAETERADDLQRRVEEYEKLEQWEYQAHNRMRLAA